MATAAAFAYGQSLLAIATAAPAEVHLYDVEHCVPAVKLQHASLTLPPLWQSHAPAGISSICFAPDAKVRCPASSCSRRSSASTSQYVLSSRPHLQCRCQASIAAEHVAVISSTVPAPCMPTGISSAFNLLGPACHVPVVTFAQAVQGCRTLMASGASLCHVDLNGPAARAQLGKRSRKERHHVQAWQPAGGNFRVLPLPSCCLLCSFITPHDVLLVRSLDWFGQQHGSTAMRGFIRISSSCAAASLRPKLLLLLDGMSLVSW